MPTPKKPKRAGRVMWMADNGLVHPSYDAKDRNPTDVPVLVLPLGDVQAIVEGRARAICGVLPWNALHEDDRELYRVEARATLLADGVPAKLLKT